MNNNFLCSHFSKYEFTPNPTKHIVPSKIFTRVGIIGFFFSKKLKIQFKKNTFALYLLLIIYKITGIFHIYQLK